MSLQLDRETAAYVRSTPKPAPARLAALLRSIAAGRDVEAARNEIVAGSIRLVVKILGTIDLGRVSPEDALSEGTLAIYDALDEHASDKGAPFSLRLRLCILRRIEDARAAEPTWLSLDALDGCDPETPDEGDPVEITETRVRIRRRVWLAVLQLPIQRRSYVLRRYGISVKDPLSADEIATEFGVTTQAVRSSIAIARRTLRRDLADLHPTAA